MYSFDTQVRVRYGETDQMGYLYYGNYALYYEVGRVETMRSLGLRYKDLEENFGVMMPVVALQTRFVRPAHYDELLTIRTTIRQLPTSFITFHVEIFNEKNKLVNGGSVRLCFVEMESKKTVEAPICILTPLKPYFD
jgi:acyl-CoA thioester hydrolase